MLVDSHCHLNLAQFDQDRTEIIARAQEAGVGLFIVPCIDLETADQVMGLADQYSQIFAAVGVHPNHSAGFNAQSVDALRNLASHPKVVAIGEIGLDYHWQDVTPAQQHDAFWSQLLLAEELGLPVIIHSRESNDDLRQLLARWVARAEFVDSALYRRPFYGVLHAFSGDIAFAQWAYEHRFVLSLGGPVTFKNAATLHALASELRPDRLMLETDAPYLTPHPHRGTRNEPAYVPIIRDRLATLFKLTPQEVETISTELAIRFFGLENIYCAGNPSPPQSTHS